MDTNISKVIDSRRSHYFIPQTPKMQVQFRQGNRLYSSYSERQNAPLGYHEWSFDVMRILFLRA